MADNFFKVRKGLNIKPESSTAASAVGDVEVLTASGKLNYHNGTTASPLVAEAHTASLTNKTIDSDLNTISNIVNANIKAGAAIAYSKLSLSNSILNADINSAAAIAYSKLNLSGSIVNADVNASAALAYSKLNLSNSILNADINASAAIAYSKLNLAGTILNADINASAAIAYSKLSLAASIVNADIAPAAAVAYSKLNLANSIVNADIAAGAAIAISKVATGLSGSLVGTTDTQTLTNKTIGDALTLTEVASPSTPSAGTVKIYPKSDKKLYFKDSLGAERAVGAGSGAINYVTNPDAEGDTTGWVTYADAAAVTPVDGTAGSANITLTRSTSSPLRGTASLLITKDAVNRQGQGVSYDFTIDTADQAKVLSVELDYEPSSGFVAGDSSDLRVYLYDVTNSTLIEPVPYTIQGGSVAKQTFKSSFQTSPNSTSYRLILHVGTTSATAWTFKFDNVKVGPQSVNVAERIVAARYTINAADSFTTGVARIVNYAVKVVDTHGAVTTGAGVWKFTAPLSGVYRVDGKVLVNSTSGTGSVYFIELYKNGSAVAELASMRGWNGQTFQSLQGTSLVQLNAGDTVAVALTQGSGGTVGLHADGLNSHISIERVATQGVADDGRIVSAKYSNTQSAALSSAEVFTRAVFTTKSWDTTNSYDTSTGLYTAPITGYYRFMYRQRINSSSYAAGSGFEIDARKNVTTVLDHNVYRSPSSGTAAVWLQMVGAAQLNAGDTMEFRVTTGGPVSPSMEGTDAHLEIDRINGPAAITASEDINARAILVTSNQTVTFNTSTKVTFNSLSFDSHAGFSTSTNSFTAPTSGKYSVKTTIGFGPGSVTRFLIMIMKNGVAVSSGVRDGITTNSSHSHTDDIQCVAGDVISINVQSISGSGNLTIFTDNPTGQSSTFVAISKIGN